MSSLQKCKSAKPAERYKNINKKHGKEWSWKLFDSQKMCTVVTKLQK